MCDKLEQLVSDYGFEDALEMGESAIMDSVCPGICMNEGCDYSTEVEPDQDKGFCEICGTQTVKSGLMLMGVI